MNDGAVPFFVIGGIILLGIYLCFRRNFREYKESKVLREAVKLGYCVSYKSIHLERDKHTSGFIIYLFHRPANEDEEYYHDIDIAVVRFKELKDEARLQNGCIKSY